MSVCQDLSLESVLDIYEFEDPLGIILCVGGQTPNNLALGTVPPPRTHTHTHTHTRTVWCVPCRRSGLRRHKCRILGTSVESIDTAEDRHKFSKLCDSLGVDQPPWSAFTTFDEALQFAKKVR